jgi:hypothetical protein
MTTSHVLYQTLDNFLVDLFQLRGKVPQHQHQARWGNLMDWQMVHCQRFGAAAVQHFVASGTCSTPTHAHPMSLTTLAMEHVFSPVRGHYSDPIQFRQSILGRLPHRSTSATAEFSATSGMIAWLTPLVG